MGRSVRIIAVLVAGLGAAACASAPARSSAAVPLEIPDPPPRAAIAPVPLPDVAQAERPVPRSPTAAAQDNPEAPPVRPAPPVPAVANPSAAPAGLRSAGPGAPSISVAHVREILSRASQKLDALNRGQLNAGRQVDYDNARRFLAQAEAAVKSNNLMLAQSSAEKAETLADGLR